MTSELIQKLAQILADTDQPDWKRSAQVLALAFEWNQESLRLVNGSQSGFIQGLNELVEALNKVSESFTRLNSLIEKVSPNSRLREDLRKEQDEFLNRTKEVETLQAEVIELEQLEKINQEIIKEKNRLSERQAELSGLASFDPAIVDALRQQVDAIEKAKPWLLDYENFKKKLEDSLPQLVLISGDALMSLQERDRQDLKKAQELLNNLQIETHQQKVALDQINQNVLTAQEEIEAKKKQYADAENQLRARKEILDQYIQVDQEIASVIDNTDAKKAQQLLDEVEASLRGVDEALRLAIITNEKAQKIQNIYL